jgi:hypothetical protein
MLEIQWPLRKDDGGKSMTIAEGDGSWQRTHDQCGRNNGPPKKCLRVKGDFNKKSIFQNVRQRFPTTIPSLHIHYHHVTTTTNTTMTSNTIIITTTISPL